MKRVFIRPIWPMLRAALLPAIGFSLLCATVFLLAIGFDLYWKGFPPLSRTAVALAILALPPAAAAGFAALTVDILTQPASPLRRAVIMAIAIVGLGVPASVGTFMVLQAITYPGGSWPTWTLAGLHDFTWGRISAIYLFVVAGLKLYLPLAPIALIIVTVYYARRPNPTLRGKDASAKDRSSVTKTPKS